MPTAFRLDARTLALCEDLELLARTVVEGFFDGLHRSPFLGYSSEFSAYRPYIQGDDLRRVDWKVWGRTDEFYVKQFEDDTNMRCHVFLDTSASMDFGAGDTNKFAYGRVLAAVLSQLMARQHDAPGLILFGDRANPVVPSLTGRANLEAIHLALREAQPVGGTSFAASMTPVMEMLTRRGLAVVISDFFSPADTALDCLRQLRAQGQEVIVFHVLAPEEFDLPYEGEMLFEDSESGDTMPVHVGTTRAEYRKRFDDFCSQLNQECVGLGADYWRLRTDAPLDEAMFRYFEWRGGR